MDITEFNLYKMYVFINMVITWVKNMSPDMILTTFDRKIRRKNMRYLPGPVDLHILQNIQY